jgi:hypothetical protein
MTGASLIASGLVPRVKQTEGLELSTIDAGFTNYSSIIAFSVPGKTFSCLSWKSV